MMNRVGFTASSAVVAVLLSTCCLQLIGSAGAKEYEVKASEDYEAACLHKVQPGDSCLLLKGDHKHDGLTITHGEKDAPITIRGEQGAVIKGSNTQDRAFQIAHNYYTLEDLSFNGAHGDDYVATAIYILGGDEASNDDDGVRSAVTGVILRNLEINNFDEECVHFRYFVTFSEVTECTIMNCGKHAFQNGGRGKVGEAIYLGTALDQLDDNKTPEPKLRGSSPADTPNADISRYIWIHHNTFNTYGNECVDIKEGSTDNLVEFNDCMNQRDPNSGGMGSRGSGNTFRWNKIENCVGAGIRVGGDKGYGVDNNIYGNTIIDADYGAFNIMAEPQGQICDNSISGVESVAVGAEKHRIDTDGAIGSCWQGKHPGDIDRFDSNIPDDFGSADGDDDTTEVEDTPSPTTEVEDTPSPTTEVEDTPSPTTEVEDTPSSTTEVEDTPSPTTEVEDTPSPITEVEDTPSPITKDEKTPSPSNTASSSSSSSPSSSSTSSGSGNVVAASNGTTTTTAVAKPASVLDDKTCYGANCLLSGVFKTFTITANSINTGRQERLGGCDTVHNVVNVTLNGEHLHEEETSPLYLFDGNLSTRCSIHRLSTTLDMQLDGEVEIHGVNLAFFVRDEDDGERIQKFNIMVIDDDETQWRYMYINAESTGEAGMQYFEFTSPHKANWVRIETVENPINNWSSLTEVEVCGAEASTNALFGGIAAADKELATLAGEACAEPEVLVPREIRQANVDSHEDVKDAVEDNAETRWSTVNTQHSNDHDNGQLVIEFIGDVDVSDIKLRFFDGDSTRYKVNIYVQSANDVENGVEWMLIEAIDAEQTASWQTFEIDQTGVYKLFIVAKGNDRGKFTKISGVEVHGC